MTNLTKKAIMESFIKLLSKKPLDKITVRDIVEDCNVTRRTFYYHYQDIYALIEDLFLIETERVVGTYNDAGAWEEGFIAAARFVVENRQAVYHLYNSIHRDDLEKYLVKIASGVMRHFIDELSSDISAEESDRELIGTFYINALVGLLNNWLENGMKDDPELIVRRLGLLFEGNIRASLLRSEAQLHKNSNL